MSKSSESRRQFLGVTAGAGALAALGLVALLAVGAYGLRSRAGGRPASDPAS